MARELLKSRGSPPPNNSGSEAFVTLTRKLKKRASAEDALAYLDGLAVHGVFSSDRSGAAVLYSEGLQHGQRLLGVEIPNPFA